MPQQILSSRLSTAWLDPDRTLIRSLAFDALPQQIALIDAAGTIIDVNKAWIDAHRARGTARDFPWIGSNYLAWFRQAADVADEGRRKAEAGIRGVLNGRLKQASREYAGREAGVIRWWSMQVTALRNHLDPMAIVSLTDITDRKLAEQRAETLALRDPLTGLANRRAFDAFLARELRRCGRDQLAISLALIDLDHFKDCNDNFGHEAGDRCLARVAQMIAAAARRPGDLAARIGGDEFALILGGVTSHDARQITEALRAAIDAARLPAGAHQVISASIGVVSVGPNEEPLAEFLTRSADKALYFAKTGGRNRVVQLRFGDPPPARDASPPDD